jgi:hypothetical protein
MAKLIVGTQSPRPAQGRTKALMMAGGEPCASADPPPIALDGGGLFGSALIFVVIPRRGMSGEQAT